MGKMNWREENFVYEVLCVCNCGQVDTCTYKIKTHWVLKYFLIIRKICLCLYSVTSGGKKKREIFV